MIKHTELRCGNLHEYYIEDKYDERKAWWEVSVIDWNDLRHLEEYPEDSLYRFIPLSEEWLIRAGFVSEIVKSQDGELTQWYFMDGDTVLFCLDEFVDGKFFHCVWDHVLIPHIHTLQNIVFTNTGKELTFKDL